VRKASLILVVLVLPPAIVVSSKFVRDFDTSKAATLVNLGAPLLFALLAALVALSLPRLGDRQHRKSGRS